MKENFWQDIKTPIITLAPMEDVTDTAFREVLLDNMDKHRLHVVFTEFTSTDGLVHEIGRDKVKHRLFVNESERRLLKEKGVKIVAQIWGADPEKYYRAVEMIEQEYDFDGIDINMGCPVKKIVKQGCCAALIDKPILAREIIQATREATTLPLSIKTRIGVKKKKTEEWIGHLLETEPEAIIIHGRIQAQQSEGVADWNEISKAVHLRNTLQKSTRILGNGDIFTKEMIGQKVNEAGVDGVMIGRGVFHAPWIFTAKTGARTPEEKLAMLWQHTSLFDKTWGGNKNFAEMKRFFKIYTSGFHGAANLRAQLMECNNAKEVRKVLNEAGA